jgi:hypothetical protein
VRAAAADRQRAARLNQCDQRKVDEAVEGDGAPLQSQTDTIAWC